MALVLSLFVHLDLQVTLMPTRADCTFASHVCVEVLPGTSGTWAQRTTSTYVSCRALTGNQPTINCAGSDVIDVTFINKLMTYVYLYAACVG